MYIRLARETDLPAMLAIYEYARKIMRESGNPNQWRDTYPEQALLREDIRQAHSYVAMGEDGQVHGTFMFMVGEEPTYRRIEQGGWLNDLPYGVIHRIANDGQIKGLLKEAAAFAMQHCGNIRIDTHADNKIMQHLLEKNGFLRCGIIYLKDGSPRIAYQTANIVSQGSVAPCKGGISNETNGL